MKTQTQIASRQADTAGALLSTVSNRLNSAMTSARATCANLQKQAAHGAKVADKKIRANPYKAAGIALGVGAILGMLLGRRSRMARQSQSEVPVM